MTGSLAYRKNEAAILAGDVPDKFTRLLPFIDGKNILEIGSAEGVLALLLSRHGKFVTAVERSADRDRMARALGKAWDILFDIQGGVEFVNADISDRLDLLNGIDTVVGVRSVYYLRDDIDRVFGKVAQKVPNVVLCGNANRARRWRAGTPDEPLGDFNRYAAREGMVELLTRHGYQIIDECREGDEIVVGKRA